MLSNYSNVNQRCFSKQTLTEKQMERLEDSFGLALTYKEDIHQLIMHHNVKQCNKTKEISIYLHSLASTKVISFVNEDNSVLKLTQVPSSLELASLILDDLSDDTSLLKELLYRLFGNSDFNTSADELTASIKHLKGQLQIRDTILSVDSFYSDLDLDALLLKDNLERYFELDGSYLVKSVDALLTDTPLDNDNLLYFFSYADTEPKGILSVLVIQENSTCLFKITPTSFLG